MLSRWLLAGLLFFPPCALAQWATISSPVNMRGGPGRDFPVVTWLRQSTPVNVVGCLSDQPWCEVVWGRRRGWVQRSYLGGLPRQVPVVTFKANS